MKIVLEGFRMYDSVTERVFPTQGTCLVQGESGRGKSTLFAAVAWALFGKESDTYSWTTKKKVCSVQVHLDEGVVVHRQKNPERLEVTLPDGRTLTSRDEAQAEVTKRYGSERAWTASAFLRQDRRNPLLEGTAADKVALLEALAFHDDVPARYLEVAAEKRKEAGRTLERAQAVAQHTQEPVPRAPLASLTHPAEHDDYNEVRAVGVAKKVRDAEEGERVEMQRRLMESHLADLEARLTTNVRWSDELYDRISVAVEINEEAEQVGEALAALPDPPEGFNPDALDTYARMLDMHDTIKATCATYALAYNHAQVAKTAETLRHALGVWKEIPLWRAFQSRAVPPASHDASLPPYPEQAVVAARREEDAHRQWVAALQRLGRTPEGYTAAVEDAQTCLAVARYVPRYQAVQDAGTAYEAHLATASAQYKDVDWCEETFEGNLTLAQDALATLRAGRDAHACPGCKKSLRLVDGHLVAANACPSTVTDLHAAEARVAWLVKGARLDRELSKAEAAMEDCECTEEQLEAWTPAAAAAAKALLAVPPAPAPPVAAAAMERHNAWLAYAADKAKWEGWSAGDAVQAYDDAKGDYAAAMQKLVACERTLEAWIDPADVPDLTRPLLKQLARACTLQDRLDALERQYTALGLAGDEPCTRASLDAERARRAEVVVLSKDIETARLRLAALPPAPPHTETLDALRTYAAELAWMPRFLDDQHRHATAQATYATAQGAYAGAVSLVERIKSVEHRVLTTYLDTFNATLEGILADIFDDPITVSLRLFDGDKPDLRWSMAYKGAQDKALTELSGGEQDRVSFAVSLALASTSAFPALLLDECFGALDATSRERCLDTLRRTLPHKPVLVIAHGETEGDYDTTLTL